ncbi:TRICHOME BIREFRINGENCE-LIKE 6 [Artemisia annua]|uniref:TRICHOME BIREFRINGENCE-LIKE 6 n=1 Tax=Artemisia annua TaxID=35608 RepID=A0A2U1P7R0_ARTAN|nr:TRICHOME BIREFRINGENCE-LIKE 6 [Artemisia annua]
MVSMYATVQFPSSGGKVVRVNYYQEADNVLPHLYSSTTFTKSMTTWASWIEKHMNPRSSAPSHFKGGESNDGGHCKEATQSPNQTTTTNNSSITELMVTHRFTDAMVTAEIVTYAFVTTAPVTDAMGSLSHGSKKGTYMVQQEMPKNVRLQNGRTIACNLKKMNETKQQKRGYMNLDATGSINEEFVIAENDVPAAGVVRHFTGAVVLSLLDIGLLASNTYVPK